MTGYDIRGCARRFGMVLLGKVEPSVHAVTELATEIQNMVGRSVDASLQALYHAYAHDEVPADLLRTLEELSDKVPAEPQSYVPPRLRESAHGRH